MNKRTDPAVSEYKAWSKKVVRFERVFIGGIVILACAFVIGMKLIDTTAVIFIASVAAIVLWSITGYAVLLRMLKDEAALKAKAYGKAGKSISDPLFKELFDEYEYNRLEGLTQNVFFHRWKLNDIDDYNNTITVCLFRKPHELIIDFTESEISIVLDEQTDDPAERAVGLNEFKTLEELFNGVTGICRAMVEKKTRAGRVH